jgi:Flp pilus assembly protein protease CpaA
MPLPFFPDPFFAWIFYAVLVGLTLVGAYLDLRKAILPKWLTFGMLGMGFVFNIVRGAWLGHLGGEMRLLTCNLPTGGSVWLGGLEGFLFSLEGFLLTAVLFIVFWFMKLTGGGDVKLFAALGAWVGFWYVLFIMLASVPIMVFLLIGRLLTGGLKPMSVQKRLKQSHVIQGGPGKGKARMTYAFPVAVAAAVVLLWFYRYDLRIAVPKANPQTAQVEGQQ